MLGEMTSGAPMSDQAKRVHKTLTRCLEDLAEADGNPKAFPPAPRGSLRAPRAISDDEFGRLKRWLTVLTEANEDVAYAALLQIWLAEHDIPWPSNVFKSGRDLNS